MIRLALVAIGILLAVAVVFGNVIGYAPVWDDELHLSHPLLGEMNLRSLWDAWRDSYEGLYIPVSYTFLGVLAALSDSLGLGRGDPAVLHAASLALHVLNAVLVYRLLRLLSTAEWPAFAASLLFAIHPLQVESAVWISEIRGLLAFSLGGLALLAALGDRKGNTTWVTGAAALLFALAVLAKPSAVVMPLFFVLIATLGLDWPARRALRSAAPFIILAVGLGAVTAVVQGFNAAVETPDVAVGLRPLVWMDALRFYLTKVLWPTGLTVSYGHTPALVLGSDAVWYSWLAPVMLASMAYLMRRRLPLVSLGIALFIVGTLPNSGLVPFTYQHWSTVADRYLYWSMLGVALVFARLLTWLGARVSLIVAATILLMAAMQSALIQVPTWKSDLSLWTRVVTVAPDQSSAWSNLGQYLPDPQARWAAVDVALRLDPTNEKALNEQGLLLWRERGNLDGALQSFNNATAAAPWYRPARLNRAAAYHQLGRLTEALAELDQLLAEDHDDASALVNRGLVHIQRSDLEAASQDLQDAIAIDPDNGKALEGLAIVALLRDDHARARQLVKRAAASGFEVQPGLSKALETSGQE